MKKIRQMTRSAAVLLLLATGLAAADLRNEDGARYEVKIHEGGGTTNSWIDGNTTVANICSDCTIEIVGVGSIKAKGSERIVIKDGKLSKQ